MVLTKSRKIVAFKIWTPELLERLKLLYKTHTHRECAEILGMDPKTVKTAILNHKLGGRGHFSFWTDELKEALTALYPDIKNSDLAVMFDCKESAIQNQSCKMKLKKSPEFMRFHSAAGMFKPGQIPPNKGQKMSPELYEKAKATMFKKGSLPHNTKTDGAITIRPDNRGVLYRHIRISLGKWISYSRYVWEQKHGPIPPGHCVWHKDYDSLNDDPGNLELITRKENSSRNSGSVNLTDTYIMRILSIRKSPEFKAAIMANSELIDIKRLQLQLNRTLNEQQNTEVDKGS